MPEKNERDKPWNYAKSCMMQFIEVSTGIVCTCLPTMRISNKEVVSKGCFAFCGLRSNKTSTNDDGKFWPRRLGKIHSISSQRGGKGDKTGLGEQPDNNISTDLGWRPGGCRTEISRCLAGDIGNTYCDESEARLILVTKELRAVDRAVIRETMRSEC